MALEGARPKMHENEEGFYFLACNLYDTSLQLYHSDQNRSEIDVKFERTIEPDVLKILDFKVLDDKNLGISD